MNLRSNPIGASAFALALTPLLFGTAQAQDAANIGANPDPISAALLEASEDVRIYNDHLTTLASPFMEGRVPGSRGMEIAKEYVEHWFRHHGLEAPFDNGKSFRQPFPLAGTATLKSQAMSVSSQDLAFTGGEDFTAMSLGAAGSFSGEAVFVGYSIGEGQDGYTNYPEGTDLTGKIAVMFRFEPMDADGGSLWSERGWSGDAGFSAKARAAKEAGAAAAIIINTPGAADPRVGQLVNFNGGGRKVFDNPCIMVSTEAGQALFTAAGKGDLLEARRRADTDGTPYDLNLSLTLSAEIEDKSTMAENVGGLIPGKGELADELVVIGAHLDHLGMGYFGSRSGPGKLHPGADDNASGSAALIMLGDRLKSDYDALPEGASARSILILAFSAEESGLNGSFYYADNPIRPIADHALMINFDMIGRIENGRLSVSGGSSGKGMADWAQTFYDDSPLDIVVPPGISGASDHTAFLRKSCPILFAIIADFHADYHTPHDTSDKINRVGAVHTVNLFHKLAYNAATQPERFEFQQTSNRRGGRPVTAAAAGSNPTVPNVRLGLMPSASEGEGLGVRVGTVTPDTAASEAGIEPGDILVRWDGVKIEDLASWMDTLRSHKPGDEVKVGIKRGGDELTVDVKLRARDG